MYCYQSMISCSFISLAVIWIYCVFSELDLLMWCDSSNVSDSYLTVCVFYCRTLSIYPSVRFRQDQLMVNKEPLQRRHSHTINWDCVGGGTKTFRFIILTDSQHSLTSHWPLTDKISVKLDFNLIWVYTFLWLIKSEPFIVSINVLIFSVWRSILSRFLCCVCAEWKMYVSL